MNDHTEPMIDGFPCFPYTQKCRKKTIGLILSHLGGRMILGQRQRLVFLTRSSFDFHFVHKFPVAWH